MPGDQAARSRAENAPDWRTRWPRVRAAQRRVRCASLPGAAVAAKPPAPTHEVRRLCGRLDTRRSDWRGGRAGPITSCISGARHRDWRVTGGTIWPARSSRSAASCAKHRSVRQADVVHAQREGARGRDPRGTGTGRPCPYDRRRSRPDSDVRHFDKGAGPAARRGTRPTRSRMAAVVISADPYGPRCEPRGANSPAK